MLLIPILIAVTGSFARFADKPLIVPFTFSQGNYSVTLDIDGKPVNLELADNLGQSNLSPESISRNAFDITKFHSLSFEGSELGSYPFISTDDPASKGGILGSDVLQSLSLGFDLEKSEVTIWREHLNADEAGAWVSSAAIQQKGAPPAQAWSASLKPNEQGRWVTTTKAGERNLNIRMLISSGNAYLPSWPEILASSGFVMQLSGEQVYGSSGVRIGALGPILIFETGQGPVDGDSPDAGMIGLKDMNSKRVIFDFAGGKIYMRMLDPFARSEMSWSHILRVPFSIVGEKLKLGSLTDAPTDDIEKSGAQAGDEIVSYRGLPAAFFISLIQQKYEITGKSFESTYKELSGQPRKLVVVHGQKTITVDIH